MTGDRHVRSCGRGRFPPATHHFNKRRGNLGSGPCETIHERRRKHQPAAGGDRPNVEALIPALDAGDRCDFRLGRVNHRRAASYREVRPTDSFHVLNDSSSVSVHVDRILPLRRRPDGSVRLSSTRIFAHNLAGARDHLTRRLRGIGSDRRAGDAAVVVTVPLG